MTNPTNKALVEAAAWRVHLSETEQDTTLEFEDWLAADLENRHAWARVDSNWNIFQAHATAPEVLALRRAALADAHDVARQRWIATDTPAAPNGSGEAKPSTKLRHSGRRWAFTLAAAATLLLGVLGWYFATTSTYRTQVGERRLVALADGSKVQLDSATVLSVTYSSRERNIRLSQGQARFDVAHDTERPFIVTAGSKKVIATGTAFNVDLFGGRVLITLIEGHVVVLPQGSSNISRATNPESSEVARDAVELAAGQEFVAFADGSHQVHRVDVERAISWQKSQLSFDDEPLSTVVQRVNRYSIKPVMLTDDSIRELRISGVFDANDIPGFLTTVTHYLPLKATVREDAIELVHR